MSTLSEGELHVQAMRLVCEALADREKTGLEVDWDVLCHMHDHMDVIFRGIEDQRRDDQDELLHTRKDRDHWKQARQEAIEAGELMRAEIETLRKELADAKRAASDEFTERQVLTVETQQDAAAWQQQVDSANAEIAYLRARLDEERSVSARLRQQLDAAKAAQALWRADSNLLERFAATVRSRFNPGWTEDDLPEILSAVSAVFEALAELDAATEPTPVAEPLDEENDTCPGK